MKLLKHPDLARRALLQRASLLGIAGAAAPWALNLSLMADAAATGASAADDYKALVCVFLLGGSDYGNSLPPVDASNHAAYASIRRDLAIPLADLQATALQPVTPLPGGLQHALAPGLAPLKAVWDAERLAVQLNIGPLVEPTTLAQYKAKSVLLPPKLFSHNDQQSIWQSSLPEGATSGWGGRVGDLMLSGNPGSAFTCISLAGNAVYLSGRNALQYQVSSNGAVAINGIARALNGSATAQQALRSLISAEHTGYFADDYSRVTRRSIDAEVQVTAALAGAGTLGTVFGTDGLSRQMSMAARLIGARAALGVKRQVIFVSLGGFDLHDNLVENQPGLLAQVAAAMKSFYDATVELGVADKVTSFTASDFGRTYAINGDGSDHGWGSHHFVMGGAVKGRRFYGTAPQIALGGPDDVGQGRLLPSTSVDQLAATLARWMGVSPTDLPLVVPGIGRFSNTDLAYF